MVYGFNHKEIDAISRNRNRMRNQSRKENTKLKDK